MTRGLSDGLPEAILIPNDTVYADSQGQLRRGTDRVVDQSRIAEYASGYRCLQCDTVQDEAFPEVCKLVYTDSFGGGCGYRMRDQQTEQMGREFADADLWPANHNLEDTERRAWDEQHPGS